MQNILEDLKQSLVNEGLLSQDELQKVEQEVVVNHSALSSILVKKGFVKEEELASFIGKRLHIPYLNIKNYTVDKNALKLIPEKVARRYKIIPLFEIEETVTIAIADPLNIIAVDDISKLLKGHDIELVIASDESIEYAINEWYTNEDSRPGLVNRLAEEIEEIKKHEEIAVDSNYKRDREKIRLEHEAKEPLVVKLVNSFMAQALLEHASDIHIEPKKNILLVRFRIDGFLFEKHRIASSLTSAVISRIKIISEMDITKRRVPQDGRISIQVRNREVDLRVSTLPSIYGENIVMRVLDKSKGIPTLEQLGISEIDMAAFRGMLNMTRGIILATGPTGSGKTTTIYSLINSVIGADAGSVHPANLSVASKSAISSAGKLSSRYGVAGRSGRNIISIENPVEYEIPDIVQSQIDPASGVTFASALKAVLRQDPDMIYLGEIRDSETAEIAARAALTGHLVISTLHTIDAIGTVERLKDIGVSPAIIGSVLNCSFAQRLIRCICPECKRSYKPEQRVIDYLALEDGVRFYKGEGCDNCEGIGYKGRSGIYEVFSINESLRREIVNGCSIDSIRENAYNQGMRSLFADGLSKVLSGITTFEELVRQTDDLHAARQI